MFTTNGEVKKNNNACFAFNPQELKYKLTA